MVYGDLIYSFAEDGTIIITGCEGTSYTLEILSEINGVAVTAIADNAFDGCSWLTSAKISDNVLAIGDRVFSDCKSLAEIDSKAHHAAWYLSFSILRVLWLYITNPAIYNDENIKLYRGFMPRFLEIIMYSINLKSYLTIA